MRTIWPFFFVVRRLRRDFSNQGDIAGYAGMTGRAKRPSPSLVGLWHSSSSFERHYFGVDHSPESYYASVPRSKSSSDGELQ